MPDLGGVRDNRLDAEASGWFLGVLEVIESLDATAYSELMSPDVELRLPDGTVLHGRQEVAGTLGAAWNGLASLVHREVNMFGDARHVVHESVAVTVTGTGETVASASTGWIERGPDGLIVSARVYG